MVDSLKSAFVSWYRFS